MNPKTFDEIVKNRANEQVQRRIEAFKSAISVAVTNLFACRPTNPSTYHDWAPNPLPQDSEIREALSQLLSENHKKGWPSRLWEEAAQHEGGAILAQLDIVQRAMLAEPPNPDGDQPVEKGPNPD